MQVLDAADDRSRWLDVWEATGREPFAHPGYCRAVAGPGQRAVALVTDRPWGRALVPLIRRELDPAGLEDVSSPYGYGGPYFDGECRVEETLIAVRRYLEDEGLVSGFLRLALQCPDPGRVPAEGVLVVDSADNVVVGLEDPLADRWRRVAHKVRKNVNKAQRAGCEVVTTTGGDFLDQFLDVYYSTMRRREAAPWFFFDRAFFELVLDELADQARLFIVQDGGGDAISVELVLTSSTRLYSYLGGTLASAFPYTPNDLLKFEIIRYGTEAGFSEYVLGGGYTPGDGIFRYKASFAPDGVVPFRTVRLIGSASRFRAAIGDAFADLGAQLASDYFPSYRDPRGHGPEPDRSTGDLERPK